MFVAARHVRPREARPLEAMCAPVGRSSDWPVPNCTVPALLRAHLAPHAFGVQRCLELVERAEARHNASYAYVVRARPDHLWEAPLADPTDWPKAQVLAPATGLDEFAIVPRSLARSYFRPFELLQHGCPLLRSSLRSRVMARTTHCAATNLQPACLFRLRLLIDGVSSTHTSCDGHRLKPPAAARVCNTSALEPALVQHRNQSSFYMCI
eukprot:7164040-Prymnesium_polylepis.2